MKTRRKAIANYVINWLLFVIFGFVTYLAYKAPFDAFYINWESSFYLGIVVGMSAVIAYLSLISVLTPVFKYLKAKISKNTVGFVDILTTK